MKILLRKYLTFRSKLMRQVQGLSYITIRHAKAIVTMLKTWKKGVTKSGKNV